MRGTVVGQGPTSGSLLKSHQQTGAAVNAMGASSIYGNMSNQAANLAQKAAKNPSSTQQKFLSKSPNPQGKLMTNTNYGKFKGIPLTQNPGGTGALPMSSVYTRGQAAMAATNQSSGQYLPKLPGNGINTGGLASSHAQLPQYSQQNNNPHTANSINVHQSSQLHYQQQHLL